MLKKTYRKPAIKQVKLVPEEAMIQGCKLGLASGARTSKCNETKAGCTLSAAGS